MFTVDIALRFGGMINPSSKKVTLKKGKRGKKYSYFKTIHTKREREKRE